MNCPECGHDASITGLVTDRRGETTAAIEKGHCPDCGAGIRRDVEADEAIAFGPGTGRAEGEAVTELRRQVGASASNFIHFCADCDVEYQDPEAHHCPNDSECVHRWPANAEADIECRHKRYVRAGEESLGDGEAIVERTETNDRQNDETWLELHQAVIDAVVEVNKLETEARKVAIEEFAPELIREREVEDEDGELRTVELVPQVRVEEFTPRREDVYIDRTAALMEWYGEDELAEFAAEEGWYDRYEMLTIECTAEFDDPKAAAKHAQKTGHDLYIR